MVTSASAKTPAMTIRTRGSRTAAGDGRTGAAEPGAWPLSRKASRPEPKTSATAARASHRVMPAPVTRAISTAMAGTDATESAAE